MFGDTATEETVGGRQYSDTERAVDASIAERSRKIREAMAEKESVSKAILDNMRAEIADLEAFGTTKKDIIVALELVPKRKPRTPKVATAAASDGGKPAGGKKK